MAQSRIDVHDKYLVYKEPTGAYNEHVSTTIEQPAPRRRRPIDRRIHHPSDSYRMHGDCHRVDLWHHDQRKVWQRQRCRRTKCQHQLIQTLTTSTTNLL